MRRPISKKNILPDTSLFDEYQKIEYLFSENKCIGTFNQFGRSLSLEFTLEQYLNDLVFSNWKLRGTAISFYNMRDERNLNKDRITKDFTIEIFIDFIELCLNSIYHINQTINIHHNVYLSDKELLNIILENCKQILIKLGYGSDFDENTGEIYVYAVNNISTAVSENNEDIADSLVEYRRHDIRGNIKKKGEILCTLYKKLESIEGQIKGTTYEGLVNDTRFLFNKTGVRHWVEKDIIASKTFLKMEPDILEEWYDRTYDLFLSCMVIRSYLQIKKEIGDIKRTDGE